jgi:hypothetical protein
VPPAAQQAPAWFVQYTRRYTSTHQTVAWPTRIHSRSTTGATRTAYEAGASRRELLVAWQRRLEVESPLGGWITVLGRAGIE